MNGKLFLDEIIPASGFGDVLKNESDTDYRATALRWLNRVGKDITTRQNNWHWRWLEKTSTFPTVAAQSIYDLPTDIDTHKIFALHDRTNSERKYIYKDMDWFRENFPVPSDHAGNAIFYTFYANSIRLVPVPAAVYTIYMDYISTLTALTDEVSSTWEIPAKYDDIVLDGVMVKAYKFEPELGDWKAQQALYESGLQRMITENMTMIDHLPVSGSHRRGRVTEEMPVASGGAF